MSTVGNQVNIHMNLLESKTISGLSVFGGTEKESFREWSYKLSSVMERLKPGTRKILQTIDTTKEAEWTSEVHHRNFNSGNLKELYVPLSRDLEWILTSKTTGEPLRKVKGAGPSNGLEAYRRLSDWYLETSLLASA